MGIKLKDYINENNIKLNMEELLMNYQDIYETDLEQRAKVLKDWQIEALLRFKDDVDEAISDYYDDEQEDKYENDKELSIKIQILQNYHDNCGGYYNKYFDEAMEH